MTIVGKTEKQVKEAFSAAAKVVEALQPYAQGSASVTSIAYEGRTGVTAINVLTKDLKTKIGVISPV